MENLKELIKKLVLYPDETEWIEFKTDNYNPDMIGKDICALANSAALKDKSFSYMIWGVDNHTHEIIGTQYNLQNLKKGGEELENWLRFLLSSNAGFNYHFIPMNENTYVGLLIIDRAFNQTVSFKKIEYIRVGSYTKKLIDYPALQSALWDKLRVTKFEEMICLDDLTKEDVLRLLSYSDYFDLMGIPQPSQPNEIIRYLIEDYIIKQTDNGLLGITNMGAILFAKNFKNFSKLARKDIRVVQYEGDNRASILKSESPNRGYACSFESIVTFICALLPSKELIEGPVRTLVYSYPIVAVREALANALIHQDFTETGTGVVVEVFASRIEITNPGSVLIDPFRIVDNPPKSRNEKLASLMRRMGLCEELGTGWDRMIIACELMRIPAPTLDVYDKYTKITLKTAAKFKEYTLDQRLWSCYMHACIKYVQGERITNSSVRARFGMPASSSSSISRLLNDAVKQGYIKEYNPQNSAPRYKEYVPIWA